MVPNARLYCVAFADAPQPRVVETDTPLDPVAGVGTVGAVGAASVVKLQTGPLVDPPVPLATICQ